MKSLFTSEEPLSWRQRAKQILFETPIEIFIGALLVGSITGVLVYRNRAARAGEIPLAYSDVKIEAQQTPPLTKFYAGNNDAVMKVFESNNIAYALGNSDKTFAGELKTKRDSSLKSRTSIAAIARQMPEDAQNALAALDQTVAAAQELPAVTKAFNDAWYEDHDDVYHTEYYTEQVCSTNSDGNRSCHSEIRTRQVYDYTWHTYNYNPAQGVLADRLLSEFLKRHPDLAPKEALILTQQVSPENAKVIRESRTRTLDGKTLSQDEYLALANTWAQGSNLAKYLPQVVSNHNSLRSLSPAWTAAMQTARDQRYRTYSHSDSGPKEYQVAESAAGTSAGLTKAAHKIIDGITFSGQKVPELDAKIKEYVAVVLEGKPGDADQLRDDIMDLARDIYDKNYENGFDVHPFKWLDVILLTMLGITVGAGLGAGVHGLLDLKKEDWYDTQEPRDRDDPFHWPPPLPPPQRPAPPPPPPPPVKQPPRSADKLDIPVPPPTDKTAGEIVIEEKNTEKIDLPKKPATPPAPPPGKKPRPPLGL